ncbi:M16 family metallopeptidase [Cesiribacter andamanensis]|uniref:Peptidase M16 inactive domain protein n=1 Tax=Cesiribacter andamanensis AMV16 TaxID=1279009 RepID=M7N7H3_9BACT|nr:pitrilysin family protein [Cesiribacter andamanensis]EMR04558.1 Peptidase M16 inactive domain protein [Cesiribacter andamanensis AMV16]
MLDRKSPPPFQKVQHIQLPQVERHQLSGGMPVHVINAGKQPVLRLEFIIKNGAVSEQVLGQSFFATKMLTEGAGPYSSKEIANILDAHGAHVEHLPGLDYCTLTLYCLSKHLPALLELFRLVLTEPRFPQKEFDILRDIKKQRILVDNTKNAVVAGKKFREVLYGNHTYGTHLTAEDVDRLQLANVIDFYKTNLQNGFELLLAGQVDDGVLQQLEHYFGDLPYRNLTGSALEVQGSGSTQRHNLPKEDSLQSTIRMGKVLFNVTHPDFHTFTVLNTALGGYFGSRLMKEIREERGYTYGIYSNLIPMKNSGYFVIGTDVVGEHTEDTLQEIERQIRLLQTEPMPDEELEIIKNYMVGSFLGSMNTPFALADKFKTVYFNGLGLEFFNEHVRQIYAASAQDIQRLARQYLDPASFATVVVGMV